MMQEDQTRPNSENRSAPRSETRNQSPYVISILVSDEGTEGCKELLTNWAPDVPVSIVIIPSKADQIDYLRQHIDRNDTFTAAVVENSRTVEAFHVYFLPVEKHVVLRHRELVVSDEAVSESSLKEGYLVSVAEELHNRGIVLFFTPWIERFIESIKLLRHHQALILHQKSLPNSGQFALPLSPLVHLLDASTSIEEIASLMQVYIESFDNDSFAKLPEDREFLSQLDRFCKRVANITHTYMSCSHLDPGAMIDPLIQRLRVKRIETLGRYLEYLETDLDEIDLIVKRLTLKNSSFFKDIKSVRLLAKTVIPSLMNEYESTMSEYGKERPIRVWVPSCSTGEDAFSLCMLLADYASNLENPPAYEIVATEGNAQLLDFVQQPTFVKQSLRNIPDILLNRFFHLHNGFYEFDYSILEHIQFSVKKIGEAPDEGDFDLIYSRGVLNTLAARARKAMLEQYRAVLAPRGVLVLSFDEAADFDLPEFTPLDAERMVFEVAERDLESAADESEPVPLFRQEPAAGPTPPVRQVRPISTEGYRSLHRELLLKVYAPVSLLIKPDFSIVDQIGHVGRFIAWPNNGHTANLLESFPAEMREDLIDVVSHSLESGSVSESDIIQPHYLGILQPFHFRVHPVARTVTREQLLQVVFLDPSPAEGREKTDPAVLQLKNELHKTQERLSLVTGLLKDAKEQLNKANQTRLSPDNTRELKIIQGLRRQNEELKSTNQELLALNRDLVKRFETFRRNTRIQLERSVQAAVSANTSKAAAAAPNEAPFDVQEHVMRMLKKKQELRTALTSIISYSRLLSGRIVDASNKEIAKKIGFAGHHLIDHLGSLLGAGEDADDGEDAPRKDRSQGISQEVKYQLAQVKKQQKEIREALDAIKDNTRFLAERISDASTRELTRYITKACRMLSECLLPLMDPAPDSPAAEEVLASQAAEPTTPRKPIETTTSASERVLVVEDSEATRRLLSLVLSDRFECEVAADASEAIKKAEKEVFKAVLMDINLGRGPTGLDVMKKLRQRNYYKGVPFMAVTAMVSPQDRSMLLGNGFDAYLPKPFQKTQLITTLNHMIQKKAIA